jgi:uncharacterized membrane protein YbhN (UPF0104 family)
VGVLIPGPPGFVGTFELFVVWSLQLFGVEQAPAFAFSIVVHVLNLLYVGIVGVAFLPYLSTKVEELFHEVEIQEQKVL